jgi:hypothetical protein
LRCLTDPVIISMLPPPFAIRALARYKSCLIYTLKSSEHSKLVYAFFDEWFQTVDECGICRDERNYLTMGKIPETFWFVIC